MIQTMEVISVNIWQIIISLCNLVLLYLILRKFLYAPVRKMLAARRATIDGQYADADTAKASALADKAKYESILSTADDESKQIRAQILADAGRRSDKVIAQANEKADEILRAANTEVELEKRRASEDMKREIADVSTKLAEKLIGREINADDQRELVDTFIDELGEVK